MEQGRPCKSLRVRTWWNGTGVSSSGLSRLWSLPGMWRGAPLPPDLPVNGGAPVSPASIMRTLARSGGCPCRKRSRGEAREGQAWRGHAGFLGPPASDPRIAAFTVLQHLTSGPAGSLPLALKQRQGLVTDIRTSHRRREWGGFFYACLTAAPANGGRALEALKAQLTGLGEGSLSEEMIEPARKAAVRSYQISMQRRRWQVLELAERALLGQSIYEVNNTLKQFQAVETEEVAAVAQEFFRPELFVAGVVPGSRP